GESLAEIFHHHLSPGELTLPPAIAGHPLGALLRRTLKKDAGQRYPSSQALWNDLQAINLTNLVGEISSAGDTGRQPKFSSDNQSTLGRSIELESRKAQVTVLCCSLPPAF